MSNSIFLFLHELNSKWTARIIHTNVTSFWYHDWFLMIFILLETLKTHVFIATKSSTWSFFRIYLYPALAILTAKFASDTKLVCSKLYPEIIKIWIDLETYWYKNSTLHFYAIESNGILFKECVSKFENSKLRSSNQIYVTKYLEESHFLCWSWYGFIPEEMF